MIEKYFEKLKKAIKGRVFVYIDAANLERSVADMWVSPKDVPDELKNIKLAICAGGLIMRNLIIFSKRLET
jgi:hypothetical protein